MRQWSLSTGFKEAHYLLLTMEEMGKVNEELHDLLREVTERREEMVSWSSEKFKDYMMGKLNRYIQGIWETARSRWELGSRISDVVIAKDCYCFPIVRCKVDGEWQLAERLTEREKEALAKNDCCPMDIAISHHWKRMCEEHEQGRGMKR